MTSTPFLLRRFSVSRAREDELVAALWEAGTLGVQQLDADAASVVLEAWFPADESGALPVPPSPVTDGWRLVAEEAVGEQDWMAPYRQRVRPASLGQRFHVDPREPEAVVPAAPEGRWLLRLPARNAFGTGSHVSTRLALELLESTPVSGARVLDVGTGTGILAFAARLLGAGPIVGYDLDPAAPVAARANRHLNEEHLPPLPVGLYAGTVAALSPAARFDLILVNVLPERIAGDLAAVAERLAPAGRLVFSGILRSEGERVLARCAALGLVPEPDGELGGDEAGEAWVAYRLQSASSL